MNENDEYLENKDCVTSTPKIIFRPSTASPISRPVVFTLQKGVVNSATLKETLIRSLIEKGLITDNPPPKLTIVPRTLEPGSTPKSDYVLREVPRESLTAEVLDVDLL
jgi:hypothetical protein